MFLTAGGARDRPEIRRLRGSQRSKRSNRLRAVEDRAKDFTRPIFHPLAFN